MPRCEHIGETPLVLKNKNVEDKLYSSSETFFHSRGISGYQVDGWTIALARGNVPDGFQTLEDFEKYLEKTFF